MQFPINLHLGPILIPSHLVFELLAFYVGLKYHFHLRDKTKDKYSGQDRIYLLIGAALGGFLGSHVLAMLEHLHLFAQNPLVALISGKTIVGGLLGGLIGVETAKKILKRKESSGDLVVFPLIVGIGIGRIGCLLTGVSDGTVGSPTSFPLAFDQGDGIPRHPAALYEILFLISLFFALKELQKKVKLESGNLFKLFLSSYLLFRCSIEFIKPVEPLILGISAIQIASLAGLCYYAADHLRNKKVKEHQ